jgi:general secretion pathway protein H
MVVVLIVGVIATFAVLSIGGRALDDRLDIEARRVKELIALAQEQAVQQGTELGFLHTPGGYQFLVLDAASGIWSPVEDGTFRSRTLSDPFYIELRVDGRAVPPTDVDQKDVPLTPQVLLLSSGEMTAFDLDVHARAFRAYYRLQGDIVGRLKLERKDEPA